MSKGPSKSFICPHCSKRFQWTTRIADRKAQCPSCHKRIRIPTVPGRIAEAVDPLPETHKSQPLDESNTYALDLTGIDESIVEAPPTPAQQAAAETGRCPACNQSINPEAVICVKCGYNLKKGKRLQTDIANADSPQAAGKLAGGAMASVGTSPIAAALDNREDEASASKFVELWLPLGLIILGITVQFIEQLYFTGNTTAGIVSAMIYVGVNLALTIPMLLVGMIVAVKFLDMAFGPLFQALFKLAAVVLGPAAIGAIIAYSIGGLMGLFAGGFFSFGVYWALISVLFDLDGIEALYLIAIVMVLEYISSFILLGVLFGMAP